MECAVLLPLTILLQVSAAWKDTNDCTAYSLRRSTHTVCVPKPANFSIVDEPEDTEIDKVLWAHNRYRSQVARGHLADFPSAANMVELRWDKELSDVARALANQGTDEKGEAKHDLMEDRFTYGFPNTGQNVLADRLTSPWQLIEWRFVVRDWFDQSLYYEASNVEAYVATKPQSDAFAQVAWATTYAVGCAYAKGNMTTLPNPKGVVVFVCNYGPAGNELGKPIYMKGPTCSRCPQHTRCNATTGLCVMIDGISPGELLEAPEPPPPNLLPTPSTPPEPQAASAAAAPAQYAVVTATALVLSSCWLLKSLACPTDLQPEPRRP